jgi:hypothetical protein
VCWLWKYVVWEKKVSIIIRVQIELLLPTPFLQ